MSTPILPLAVWEPGTNQNSIPANDNALRLQLLNGLIISDAVTAQPGSPTNGDAYIMAPGKTGTQWALFDVDDLAIFMDGTWYAYAPVDGIVVNVAGDLATWDGSAGFVPIGGGGGGVTSVDAANGVEVAAGTPITATGTIRGSQVVNAQTGTSYALAASDRGKRVTLSNAGSIAATIAQAGTTGFENGYYTLIQAIGVGAVTLTPTTSTINGAATLMLDSGMSAMVFSDGTNYRALVFDAAGVAVNAQTGTSYTYVSGDRGKLVTHSNGSAIAGTLPQATGAFGAGWFMYVQNRGAGTLTITPTTSTIDGAASLALTTGQGILVASDGTNYYTLRGLSAGGGGSLTNWTEAANSSAPNATVPVVSFTATNAATNADAAVIAKGTGATLAQIPDNGTGGGNKRGTNATDWQKVRTANTQVASGIGAAIAGGERNTAAGQRATVAGGLNNNAQGNTSAIGGGQDNQAGSQESTVAGGNNNNASGTRASILGGISNTASGQSSSVTGGETNTASGAYSRAGGQYAHTRGVSGADSFASAQFSTTGDAQRTNLVIYRSTTNATPAVLSSTGAAGSTTNQVLLQNNSAKKVTLEIVARDSVGNAVSWTAKCLIKRGANAGATSIVGTALVTQDYADTALTGCIIALTADTTNGCLAVTATGIAATNIKWVASVKDVEVVG